jgi:transposase-like protein
MIAFAPSIAVNRRAKLTSDWSAPLGVDGMKGLDWPVVLGFQRMKAMTRHRSHSAAFKRQVAQEFIAGETLHGLSKRHDISRQLIRIWVGKYEAGALMTTSRPRTCSGSMARTAALTSSRRRNPSYNTPSARVRSVGLTSPASRVWTCYFTKVRGARQTLRRRGRTWRCARGETGQIDGRAPLPE